MLYKTFENALPSESDDPNVPNPVEPFGVKDLLTALGTFLGVSIGSVIIGVSVALGCCFIFKKIDFSTMPVYEFTLVALFAYSSYFLAEIAYLSGIMSLFFCSICLAHYNYYNIVSLENTSLRWTNRDALLIFSSVFPVSVHQRSDLDPGRVQIRRPDLRDVRVRVHRYHGRPVDLHLAPEMVVRDDRDHDYLLPDRASVQCVPAVHHGEFEEDRQPENPV